TLRPFFFFREKRNKKTRPLPPQQRGFCSRSLLKISKGQVVFFEKITQKISTYKPLPIFILSVLFSLPTATLTMNNVFSFFRCCLAYRKPDSAKIKFLLSFGFLV